MKTVKTHITQLLHAMNMGIFEKNIPSHYHYSPQFQEKVFSSSGLRELPRALLQGA